MITTSMPEVKLFDIVRLSNGDQLVVTQIKPNRPANPFIGVLVNGQGAEYKFGPKHRPIVLGQAPANHPALIALNARKSNRPVGQDAQAVIHHLLEAVEAGDLPKAKILAAAIRTMPNFGKPSGSTTYDEIRKMVRSPEFQNAK